MSRITLKTIIADLTSKEAAPKAGISGPCTMYKNYINRKEVFYNRASIISGTLGGASILASLGYVSGNTQVNDYISVLGFSLILGAAALFAVAGFYFDIKCRLEKALGN